MTGEVKLQKCRKWYLSSHACESEIIRTAYKAIEAAELHELQENFIYCGQRIFDPHLNLTDLAAAIGLGGIGQDVRDPQPLFESAPAEMGRAVRRALGTNSKAVSKKSRKPPKR
jgi:hypothetical protein